MYDDADGDRVRAHTLTERNERQQVKDEPRLEVSNRYLLPAWAERDNERHDRTITATRASSCVNAATTQRHLPV
jgi:hypothetical protein